MLPASGGNLSGGCNSAGSSTYDLISPGILLEHNFFKIHFIGWSPNVEVSTKFREFFTIFVASIHWTFSFFITFENLFRKYAKQAVRTPEIGMFFRKVSH